MAEAVRCFSCSESDEKNKNFERRLQMITQEKNMAYKMFQESVNRIEQLEEELDCSNDVRKYNLFKDQIKEMHIQMQHDYSDAIDLLEHKLSVVNSSLQGETKKVSQKEAELLELRKKLDDLRTSEDSLKELQTKEQSLRERCLTLESKCLEYESMLQKVKPNHILEDEIERLTRQLEIAQNQRDEIQQVLEDTQTTAEKLVSQENEARNKVSEAIALVESSFLEKQQIQNQLIMTQNECKRLQKELIDLIEEAGSKVKCEVEILKKKHQEEIRSAISQLDMMEKDRCKKIFQIEKQQSEICKLETELEEVKRSSVSQRKLQAVLEQLRMTEMQLVQFQTQNQNLSQIITQNQQRFETELGKCAAERRFMEKQIIKLQSKLGETGFNLDKAVDQCKQLSDELAKLSSELANERSANESGNGELLRQLQITKNQSNSAMVELKKIVQAHSSITSKWKDEYSTLTKKFNDKMKELKIENRVEKRRNKKLLKKLTSSQASNREGFVQRCDNREGDYSKSPFGEAGWISSEAIIGSCDGEIEIRNINLQ